jgi:hypothetical protein
MIAVKGILIFVFVVILSFSYFFSSQAERWAKEEGERFSLKEKLWAAKWINEKLALLMEDGLIKRIKCFKDDRNYEVFVSSSWSFLDADEKSDFIRNLSRAREITQHSPYLVVKDNDSGEVVAQVNEWGILIFGKEGEQFLPVVRQEEKDAGASPQVE